MTRVSINAEDLGVFAMHANHRSTIGRVNATICSSEPEPILAESQRGEVVASEKAAANFRRSSSAISETAQ
jgi:hypothetical protein